MQAAATVEKAIDVLFALHARAEPMGVTSLGRALGLPKSSTHRLLAALARRQLVERDSRGRYRTGMGLVALGLGTLRSDPLVLAARPVLESTCEVLGETTFLVGVRAHEPIVLDKVEGSGFLRAAPTVGARLPLHRTAVGKLLLAFGAAPRAQPLGTAADSAPESPRLDPAALERELDRTRERGYAESHGEWIPGLAVVAAPIRAGAQVDGALAIAAPQPQMEALGFDRAGRHALRAAAAIESRLRGELE